MIRHLIIGSAAAALVMTAALAGAQTKVVPGETKVVTVTVEAVDHANRQLTVKKADGTYDVFYIPETIKRFDTVKVGDKITAKFYENMVLQVKPAGSPAVNTASGGTVRSQDTAAATSSHQRTITATITAIDMKAPSITFTGPQNWKYSSRVKDTEALSKVKVGDKVDITWTEAMVLSIDN